MRRSALALAAGFLLVLAGLTWASIEWLPMTGYFPRFRVMPVSGLTIEFWMKGHDSAASCEATLATMAQRYGQSCPGCSTAGECRSGLDSEHRTVIGFQPIGSVSLRLANGVVVFQAPAIADAMAICQASATQLGNASGKACIPPGEPRPPDGLGSGN